MCVIISAITYKLFKGDLCDEPLSIQIEKQEEMFVVRQTLINLYIVTSIFMIPFSELFWPNFAVYTGCFTVEMSVANFKNASFVYYISLPIYWMMMLVCTYFMKRILIQFFLLQSAAEKTSAALTEVLDNLPDAVLMFEKD